MSSVYRLDPLQIYHFLRWRIRCLEASGTGFQELFEEVARRLNTEDFMRVRPYGRIGDRKMDGLFVGEKNVFQVYSPDELKQAQLVAKMQEDLEGAIDELGDRMDKWTFVYNTRRGNPPDVALLLQDLAIEHAGIEVAHMSDYGLWKLVRENLTPEERTEILSAPPEGWHELFGRDGGSVEALAAARVVLLHESKRPIDQSTVLKALHPEPSFGAPFRLRVPDVEDDWNAAASYQREQLEQLFNEIGEQRARFAVFSLAHIPLAIHLGYLLSDQVDAKLFQFHRAPRDTWAWDEELAAAEIDADLELTGAPNEAAPDDAPVVIRVSLSATVRPADTRAVAPDSSIEVDMSTAAPDVRWLRAPEQLEVLEARFRDVLAVIRRHVPESPRIHLFYAGPAPGAVALGRVINPTMNPPVSLYEYRRQRSPRYEHVLTLDEESAGSGL